MVVLTPALPAFGLLDTSRSFSPDTGNQAIEDLVGGDDGDAATHCSRDQKPIERAAMRPVHGAGKQTICGFERGDESALALEQFGSLSTWGAISGHFPTRTFCAISKNEIALT
jgi:hypothetical protein